MMKTSRRYLGQFAISLALFPLLLVLAIVLLAQMLDRADLFPLHLLVILLPVIPVLLALRAYIIGGLGTLDELQRHIHMNALAFSLAGTGFLGLIYGMLEAVGVRRLNSMLVVPVMLALYGIGLAIANRRYR